MMNQKMSKKPNYLFTFITIPATVIGVYTMRYFNVPNQISLFNLAFVCFGILISFLFLKNNFQLKNINPILILIIIIAFLFGTFWHNGIIGVHRWINLGAIQLNMGLIVSPVILLQISRIKNFVYQGFFVVLITLLFLVQPDASLVMSF